MSPKGSERPVVYTAAAALVLAAAGILAFASALWREPSVAAAASEAHEATPRPQTASSNAENTVVPVLAAAGTAEAAKLHAPSHPPSASHPLTPAHARLRLERNLIARLDDALDARNAEPLRRALAEYEREFSEQQRQIAGYRIIAACLEDPSAARADAQSFYDAYRSSTLRRWIRVTCLDPDP